MWPEANGRCAQATPWGTLSPVSSLMTWLCLASVGIGVGTLGISSWPIAKAMEVQLAEEPTMTEPQVNWLMGGSSPGRSWLMGNSNPE